MPRLVQPYYNLLLRLCIMASCKAQVDVRHALIHKCRAVKAGVIKIRQENILKKTGKTREDIELAVNQLVESKKFSDRLKEVLQRDINQGITNVEIIEKLIKMAGHRRLHAAGRGPGTVRG